MKKLNLNREQDRDEYKTYNLDNNGDNGHIVKVLSARKFICL